MNKSDLKINGLGTTAGGEFALVRVNGHGKINGDVSCDNFIINGTGETAGNVACGSASINGTCHIHGSLKTQEIKVHGTATIDEKMTAQEVRIAGTATFKGDVTASDLKVNGSTNFKGSCNAEVFRSNGLFNIAGLLSADKIDVSLSWSKSYAKEVGGENIAIRMTNKGLGFVRNIVTLGTTEPLFEADLIEGNDITLENTRAKVVRGHNITLLSGCEIGLVEYTGELNKQGSAKTSQENKI